MRRIAYSRLLKWKDSNNRKPLILNGARQVGKTWLLEEFGKTEYENVAYINCDKISEMKTVFSDYDTNRLIRMFSVLSDTRIQPRKTLIVLDEIQVVPEAITSLKYFCEDAPEYHIAVAGSLLGIGMHEGTGYPVGKVDEIQLYPLCFKEFLMALNQDALIELSETHQWKEISMLSGKYIEVLRQFYYVGGMPEVVKAYVDSYDFLTVRKKQEQILADYKRDFGKHIPDSLLPKVRMVWESIPAQLAKENKKFIYGAVKKGSRAKDFEDAIQWLIDAGLVYKVNRIDKVEKPLKFYEDFDAFKLFILDLGLLGAIAGVDAKDVLIRNDAFVEYKGAFTEQYVLQELISCGEKPYYYTKSNSTLELDFVVQHGDVYPIEVKAETNVKSKSLKTVYEGNHALKPIRTSMMEYQSQDWLVNVPLYLIQEWFSAIK